MTEFADELLAKLYAEKALLQTLLRQVNKDILKTKVHRETLANATRETSPTGNDDDADSGVDRKAVGPDGRVRSTKKASGD